MCMRLRPVECNPEVGEGRCKCEEEGRNDGGVVFFLRAFLGMYGSVRGFLDWKIIEFV